MKIAVLSDIHGNLVALEAVLKDLARQGTVAQIIAAGDFFAPGPETKRILEALQDLPGIRFLRGNADRYLLDGSYTAVYSDEGWQRRLREAFRWTDERLGPRERRFLAALPFSYLLELSRWPLLAVHGSPRSDEEGLTPDTPAERLEQMSIPSHVGLISCGHTHVPMDRLINGVRVVNCGSVGLPFDGDNRACYALFSNLDAKTPEFVSVELRRVEYNIEQAIKTLYAVKHPAADMGAYNLRHGRPQGTLNIYKINDAQ